MPLGFHAISESAIAEIPDSSSSSSASSIDLDISSSLLFELGISSSLLFDLGIDSSLYFNLQIASYLETDMTTEVTEFSPGSGVVLATVAYDDNGGLLTQSLYTIKIRTPLGVQLPDISGNDLLLNTTTRRFYYVYPTTLTSEIGIYTYRFGLTGNPFGGQEKNFQVLRTLFT